MLLLLLAVQLAASPPVPLARTLADADRDGVPDAVGRTVVVAGRASVGSGGLGARGPAFFVQDATGGIRIDRPDGPAVAMGDSVVAVGRLAFRDGLAVLDRPRVRRAGGPRRAPVPLAYPSGAPESAEGRLVVVEATVAGLNPVEAGDALLLSLPDGGLVVAFVFHGRAEALPLRAFAPGDRVRVVGVAGQYDRAAPYRDAYQVYPRTAADVRRADIPAGMYRPGALAALGLLALALTWAWTLRRQVARRVAELRGSEERYRQLVERASDAVLVHDIYADVASARARSAPGVGLELNAAARRAFGLPPDGPVPYLTPLFHPDDLGALQGHMARLGETGNARSDFRIVRPDGTDIIYEFESQTITLDGRTRVLSLARDVGARRAYERGLVEARQAAEEAVRAKDVFMTNMSHEIRTPLTAVIGFADLLADEVGDDQRDLVEAIESGGRRLLSTLNSVLDLARLDAGREALRPERIDLVAHVGQSVRLLGTLASRKGLALDFAPASPALQARLDAGAVDRVLVNLVGNAIKFTDRGGITVTLTSDGETATLAVADTGIGMSPTFLPEVFGEFRQESEGAARAHEGTGLGLAITRRLVELMDGTIAVESTWGAGTTFTVVLPLGPAENDVEETDAVALAA